MKIYLKTSNSLMFNSAERSAKVSIRLVKYQDINYVNYQAHSGMKFLNSWCVCPKMTRWEQSLFSLLMSSMLPSRLVAKQRVSSIAWFTLLPNLLKQEQRCMSCFLIRIEVPVLTKVFSFTFNPSSTLPSLWHCHNV